MCRPREAYLEENNPGDKAMMRKLIVTVFAMSLTLVGCGSSSTTKPDAGSDVKAPGAEVGLDTAKLDRPVVPPDGQLADLAQPADVAVDTAIADVAVTEGGVDAGDAGSLTPDTRPVEAGRDGSRDGSLDFPPVKLDAPDAAAIDAPDVGDGSALEAGDGGDGRQDG